MSSLVDYIKDQESLEKQAKEHMPYDCDKCTFELGSIRQELYACLTCYRLNKKLNAICYACSINCHTSHDLIELFTKRSFTCDCGTSKFNLPCNVRYPLIKNLNSNSLSNFDLDIPDLNNKYNHNFKGYFCSCNNPYNPQFDSNMIQCIFGISCGEDWYHDDCLMGFKPGFMNRKPLKIDDPNNYDLLPLPGFPSFDSFETLICWKCASQFPLEMSILINKLNCDTIDYVPNSTSIDDRILKISNNIDNNDNDNNKSKRLKKDYLKSIFLKENYKEKLSEIVKNENPNSLLVLFLLKYPFLFNDDPIYQPPIDDDDSSVFEMGVRELNNLPKDKAVKGLIAYEKIKSKLTDFLKPFADEGRIVTAEEVKAFFDSETNKIKK
ncbi:hypothetical protein C6P40_003398 [Pichia californica]|uniref:UBR-type domain-containing protein n=1 Tax=Pichia californica TaxID=460514 RepID=A0A9P6WJ85_9ASCO|nr:hypothetical protein C6P42_002904 [[Candida] californica]KAG0686783.1 hypothetical protein C6P40_003398 [[Candida] californica]